MSHKNKDKASDASASSSSSASEASEKKSKHKEKKVDKKKSKTDKKKTKSNRKEKAEKKSSKRGPRGAQWTSWKIPYQEKSILGQSFQLAAKKGGVDLKKLEKQIKTWKGTPAFILRKLKKGHSKGFKWDVDDSHGRLRILHCKLVDKKWHKA